jgi:hypothetical protein
MGDVRNDIRVLRELAEQYAQIAQKPVQEERRDLWRAHNSLERTHPLVLVTYGMHNVWCEEVFGDHVMECQDPFYRAHERYLRMMLFHDTIGDDYILEPWITQRATVITHPEGHWGVRGGNIGTVLHNRVWHFDPPIREWEDVERLQMPHHMIDEEASARNVERLEEAIGDILEVDVGRGPALQGFNADLSTDVALMRGLNQLMLDMYDSPQQLHALLAFLRDGVLMVHREAERAGDWSLTSQVNQAMCYARDLESPRANSGSRRRKDLWCFCAAQELTLVSPVMHDEFMLQYQLPIIEQFGLVAYGCCENLTRKIDMLRRVPNLRIIAVTPSADVAECAEQIGTDYVLSWRPNPTDMFAMSSTTMAEWCTGLLVCRSREGMR